MKLQDQGILLATPNVSDTFHPRHPDPAGFYRVTAVEKTAELHPHSPILVPQEPTESTHDL